MTDTPPASLGPLDPADPPQIGRYRLLGQLGRGGMGTVYLGEDERGEKAAVKVINAELATEEAFRTRFRREAEAAQRVRRFCTAAVLDVSLEGNLLYVANEYVPGPTLDQAVRDNGPLSGSSLEALAVGVATALTAIHGAGIIHRDLKPSNVLLSPVGPRVIDFGIARALDMLGDATRTGEIIGTPLYMAPEALRGEPVTPACDIFSWGCLVAFAGTGRPPFTGDSMPTVLYHILGSEPQLANLDPALQGLVAEALAKDPRQRPTAQDLMNRLVGHTNPAQAAHTMAAPPWQGPPPGGQPTAHYPPQSVPGTVAQTAVGGQPTALHTTGPGMGTAGQSGSRWKIPLLAGGGALVLALLLFAAFTLLSGGPPTPAAHVFGDDFSNTSSGWPSDEYDPEYDQAGYQGDGTYAVDASGDDSQDQKKYETAPLPTTATPSPDTDGDATPMPKTPESLLIGVDATTRQFRAPGEYGLWCRGGDGSGYHFLVDGKGNAKIKREKDQAALELGQSQIGGFNPREKHTIQAKCEESDKTMSLALWVDGSETVTATDPTPLPNGSVGITAQVPGKGPGSVKVSFDNFVVSRL